MCPKCTEFDTALTWVPIDKPAQCGMDRNNSSCNMWIAVRQTDGQTEPASCWESVSISLNQHGFPSYSLIISMSYYIHIFFNSRQKLNDKYFGFWLTNYFLTNKVLFLHFLYDKTRDTSCSWNLTLLIGDFIKFGQDQSRHFSLFSAFVLR